MLTHVSLLGAFFSLWAVSCTFVERFLLMLIVFLAFWVAPGPILERPGSILEGPIPHFSMLFRARWLAMLKNFGCAKTTVFPRLFHGFYTSQALCSGRNTKQNHSRSLSNEASCKECAKNISWRQFWKGLVLSWASLGQFLPALGRLLASLGHSWLSRGCSGELQRRI